MVKQKERRYPFLTMTALTKLNHSFLLFLLQAMMAECPTPSGSSSSRKLAFDYGQAKYCHYRILLTVNYKTTQNINHGFLRVILGTEDCLQFEGGLLQVKNKNFHLAGFGRLVSWRAFEAFQYSC